jgi:transcriptional regulator with XRE-family HTH domain
MPQDRYLYEALDLSGIQTPKASRLYHLEPCGIDTPLVESLTGYISRLAEAHCVFPGILMERLIAPVVEKKYSSANLHTIYGFTGAVNGKGTMAKDIVSALEGMTGSHKLECLTLLNLSELLPSWNLLRRNRAWCPKCYEHSLSANSIVYDCLLWTLKPVKVCPFHCSPLVEKCPHCDCHNLPLTWKTRPGCCGKCGKWLGATNDEPATEFSSSIHSDFEHYLWTAENLGQLLAASSSLKEIPYRDRVAQSLNGYAGLITQGNLAALARHLQVPKNTFWLWCRGKNQPSLEALLRICYCLKVPIVDFLLSEASETNAAARSLPSLGFGFISRAQNQGFDIEKMRLSLEEVLESSEQPPPSMEEVARRLQCDRRTIYRHFRDLCHQISVRHTKYRRESYLQAVREVCQEVRQAATEIYNRGEYPTEALVCEEISRPGYLRYKQVRQALKNARQELGLEK